MAAFQCAGERLIEDAMKPIYIYGLFDSAGKCRYVGQTTLSDWVRDGLNEAAELLLGETLNERARKS